MPPENIITVVVKGPVLSGKTRLLRYIKPSIAEYVALCRRATGESIKVTLKEEGMTNEQVG